MRTISKYLALAVLIFLISGQAIRPGRTNPPSDPAASFEVAANPSPEVITTLKRACYDCHSNNTVWPWYSNVAPVSWLLADDVKDGRAHLNFSEWGLLSREVARKRLQASCKEIKEGEMPLWQYRLMHPGSKPSEQDVAALCGAAQQVR